MKLKLEMSDYIPNTGMGKCMKRDEAFFLFITLGISTK
jgi:hypothetical protein